MDFETLKVQVDHRQIATLTLNRPEVHNVMNSILIQEMREALTELQKIKELRALVLTGNGKSFCAGADLLWMKEMTGQDDSVQRKAAEELTQMLSELNRFGLIVIGRINGSAYGGGVGLVSCCDITIGSELARFSLKEVTLGVIPATIAPFVVQRIGSANTRRVMLNAFCFDAGEAVQFGLLHRSVPDSELDKAVEEELQGALRSCPEAVRASKELIGIVGGRHPESVREDTVKRLLMTWKTESCREGISAFLEKRKPDWFFET